MDEGITISEASDMTVDNWPINPPAIAHYFCDHSQFEIHKTPVQTQKSGLFRRGVFRSTVNAVRSLEIFGSRGLLFNDPRTKTTTLVPSSETLRTT